MYSEITKDWIYEIAEKLYPNISKTVKLIIFNKCYSSYSDIRLDEKVNPTIYIGTLNKSRNAIIGSLAHEIVHVLQRDFDFTNKFYYRIIRRIIKSNEKANKYAHSIALLTGYIYKHETKVDRLGLKLLTSAGFESECMFEMLEELKPKGLLQYILKRRRLSAIKKFAEHQFG